MWTVCSPVTHDLGCRICRGAFDAVWVDLPFSRACLPPDKRQALVHELASWYRHAGSIGTQAYLAGLRAHTWQHPDLQKLLSDHIAFERRFSDCRF